MTLRSWIKRISRAAYYKLGMRFPYSKVRVWAMRKLGYYVGTDVYFPSDLIISQNFVEWLVNFNKLRIQLMKI